VDELCTKIKAEGHAATYEQVLSLIADRYGKGLYERVSEGNPADVEVLITRPELDPICVRDSFRHVALQRNLLSELGSTQVEFGFLPEARVKEDLTVELRYRIVPEAQLALFAKFLDELPALLAACFPISSPESPLEVELGGLHIDPPAEPAQVRIGGQPRTIVSSRYGVHAQLALKDRRDGRSIDSGWFALCNFFGPRPDGRIAEPGQSRQRAFDEIALTFPDSIRSWLTEAIPGNLAALAPGEATIRTIFEFED
jgi:hypothetical protein